MHTHLQIHSHTLHCTYMTPHIVYTHPPHTHAHVSTPFVLWCVHTPHTHVSILLALRCVHTPPTHTLMYPHCLSCGVSSSRTRNTDRNSAEGAWRATGQSTPSHWLPCPGARLALPLLPHEAVPTASLDSPRHASPDQTQLRNEEEKKPTLSRAASQYPMQILVAKA